jgi:hypothetical protein
VSSTHIARASSRTTSDENYGEHTQELLVGAPYAGPKRRPFCPDNVEGALTPWSALTEADQVLNRKMCCMCPERNDDQRKHDEPS